MNYYYYYTKICNFLYANGYSLFLICLFLAIIYPGNGIALLDDDNSSEEENRSRRNKQR